MIDEGEEHTLSYTSDIRAVHILNRNGKRWIIAEPPPDAAFAYTDQGGGNFSLSLINVGGGGLSESMTDGSEDLPLVGRAAYVLLARELNYRINEMAFNTNASFEQYLGALKIAMETVKSIALIEAAQITNDSKISVISGSMAAESITDDITVASTENLSESDATTTTKNLSQSDMNSMTENLTEDDRKSTSATETIDEHIEAETPDTIAE